MSEDLCKYLYEREWARRDQHQSAVSTPLGIFTALAGALLYMYQQTLGAGDGGRVLKWPVLFYCTFSLASIFSVAALACLIRSFVGYAYEIIPLPQALLDYRNGLRAHYASVGEATPAAADAEFAEFIDERYTEAAEANARVNTMRGAWLHRSSVAIAAALGCAALSAIPVAATLRTRKSEPQQVEIVNMPFTARWYRAVSQPPEVLVSDSQPSQPSQTPTNQQQPAPIVPKPVPPTNQKVRGGDTTPRPLTQTPSVPGHKSCKEFRWHAH